MTQPLVQAIQASPSQPSTVRIGRVVSVDPLTINVQGTVFVGVGYLDSYVPAVDDVVALLGQSAVTSDAASWLCLGGVNTAETPVPVEFVVPQAKAWASTLTGMANSVTTVINLASESWDSTGTMHDTAVNNSRIVAPVDGRYLILASLGFAANAVGRRICQVRLNAAGSGVGGVPICEENHAASPTGTPVVGAKVEYELVAGDYVEMFGNQTSGGALNDTAEEHQTFLSIRWMSEIS